MLGLKRKSIGIVLFVGTALVSCATAPDRERLMLQWPEPPLTPRVEFVQVLASEEDLGRSATWSEVLVEILTGRRPPRWHLFQPMDVVVSDDGQRVYISDLGQLEVFAFDFVEKRVDRLGLFDRPFGLALDAQGRLFVVEQATASIQVLSREGERLRTIRHAELIRPTDIALDRERGLLYVADPARKEAAEHTVKVFDLEGTLIGKIGTGKGQRPGQLYFPTYLALDRAGNLYVSSTMSARIDVFSPEGEYLRSIGERGNAIGMFDKPKGIALDNSENIYVVDSGWSNVQIFNPDGQVLLFFGGRGAYPGLLKNPTGIAIDRQDRIYVADLLNSRLTIYRVVNTKERGESQSQPQPAAMRLSEPD